MQSILVGFVALLCICSCVCASELCVAAVQTELRLYTARSQFETHMRRVVRMAADHEPDLIVLPEDLGTGLMALGAPDSVMDADSMQDAMVSVAAVKSAEVSGLAARGVPLPRAIMLAQAEAVRAVYVDTFSALAQEMDVWIAAGTVLLPHEGADDLHVYNTFYIFGPDGTVAGTADKVNLIPLEAEEGMALVPGSREALAPWQTAVGAIGPVVCADAWDAELVGELVEQGAELLLCPSANPEPWSDEVRVAREEGLRARVRELGVPGVECFGVGRMAGLMFEGVTQIMVPDADAADGVRVVASAGDPVGECVVVARVQLPAPGREK